MSIFEKVGSLLLLGFALLIRFPFDYYLFDIIHSFAIQISILYLLLMAILFLWKKRLLALSSLAGSLLVGSLFIHWLWQDYTQKPSQKSLTFKVAHFNVWKKNTAHEKIIKAAKNTQATILSFEEINDRWWDALQQGLKNDYPHYHVVVRDDNFGIAVFSKYPLTNIQEKYFSDVPSITASIQMPFGTLQWVSSHTLPPKSNEWYQKRNGDLNRIAQYMQGQSGYKLAVGDYNTVSWAPVLRRFKKTANLQDARRSFTPSWPTWNWLLGVPIDHIFYSPAFRCLNFDIVPKTPSDHWGIEGTFTVDAK